MKKFAISIILISLVSCWKNNKEQEEYYAEDHSPIDSTLVDSVVGKTSFLTVNSAIENSKKESIIPKKDTTKTLQQKLTEEKKKLEEAKKKSEANKKLIEQKEKESIEKEQQQEENVDEL